MSPTGRFRMSLDSRSYADLQSVVIHRNEKTSGPIGFFVFLQPRADKWRARQLTRHSRHFGKHPYAVMRCGEVARRLLESH
jgi:hypothetical protein